MGLQQGTFANAIVSVDNDGNVTRIQNGPRTAARPSSAAVTDLTGTHVFNTAYQNLTGRTAVMSGWGAISSGASGDSTIKVLVGPTNPPTMGAWGDTEPATVAGEPTGFIGFVPNTWWVEIVTTGHIDNAPGSWLQTLI